MLILSIIAVSVPIIAFSGGTSLEGHFTAPQGGICISFTQHMDNIVEFHPDDLDIVVQPGVQWEDLNNKLKEHGLFFPMDPGPGYVNVSVCTVKTILW